MKFYTKIILGLSALLLTSCNDWLDLKPDTQATEEEVYATGNGFRSVLNNCISLWEVQASMVGSLVLECWIVCHSNTIG